MKRIATALASLDPLADINDVGSFDLSRADQISIGMHNSSTSLKNTLDVSDVVLVGR